MFTGAHRGAHHLNSNSARSRRTAAKHPSVSGRFVRWPFRGRVLNAPSGRVTMEACSTSSQIRFVPAFLLNGFSHPTDERTIGQPVHSVRFDVRTVGRDGHDIAAGGW